MKQNKRVLITGASRGIGEAIARRLSRAGFELCLHANHSRETLLALAEELGASTYFADFEDPSQVLRLADEVGAVDVLINNAGIAQSGLYQDLTDQVLDRLIAVNLRAPMDLTRRLIPSMIRNHSGVIVNVSSIWGQTGASMEVAYSAVKAGLIGFSKALAKELAPSGVRVNCVCPGAIRTEMMDAYDETEISDLCDEIPLGRLGTAQEVAECVHFLTTDASSYLTGQVLSPNGGLLI